jgi:uncharacterized tellurite resistance protein B-like protein
MSAVAEMSKLSLADGSSASFLIRWQGRQEGPFPASVIEAKLADNEIGLLHEIFHNGQWMTMREFLAEKKNSIPNFQIVLATDEQKGKLRFFGCTWDEGITAGQASDAIEECARQFPDAEATWQKNQPATEKQKEKLRYFGCTWSGDITVGKASDALVECAREFPDREAAWQFQKRKWLKISESFPLTPLQRDTTAKTVAAKITPARQYSPPTPRSATTIKSPALPGTFPVRFAHQDEAFSEDVPIQKAETVGNQPAAAENPSFTQRRYVVEQHFLPTSEQIAELRLYGKETPNGLTYSEAQKLIAQCKIEVERLSQEYKNTEEKERLERQERQKRERQRKEDFLRQQAADEKRKADANPPAVRSEGFFCGESPPITSAGRIDRKAADQDWRNHPATEKQRDKLRAFGCKFDEGITVGIAMLLIENHKSLQTAAPAAPGTLEVGLSQRKKEWDEWVALHERLEKRQNPSNKTPSEEVTIQEAATPQNASPREIIPKAPKDLRQIYEMVCPACDGKIEVPSGTVGKKRACPHCQAEITPVFFKKKPAKHFIPARIGPDYAPRRPAIQKPAAYISAIPIERFTKWLDIVLERNNKCLGGHWLPVGPVCWPLKQYTTITTGLSCQMSDAIEARGYCVEPDARFGNGKYDNGHTLALFKPFDGDPIHPSTAYLGAANLLRLCILITTADGQIDLVELEVFRQAIEHQPGLTRTDHKRLLILEQLLTQELSSALKTAAKIAKSIPAEKRLVIGKLLVEVAAANNIITNAERHALEEIFRILKISQMMLKHFINQYCPRPNSFGVQDVSEENRYQWDNWRTNHPGVVIEDTTLTEKTWNFTDWKALNARWRDLHERLVEKQFNNLPGADSSGGGTKVDGAINRKNVSAMEEFLAAGRLLGASGEEVSKKIEPDDGFDDDQYDLQTSGEQVAKKHLWKFGFCKCCENKDAVMSRSPSGEVRSYCIYCEGEIKQRVFDQHSDRWIMRGQTNERPVVTRGELISKPIAAPAPRGFALDMERVYQITNETKEVVAILSVVMADEPEESIKLPTKITLPVQETPKNSSDSKDAPQPTRFNGLDAAFHPILERLLTRESWPADDFDAFAREFHFMPGKICETINEWSDEALGEFILDGDDPVVIRRELIAKETIYG